MTATGILPSTAGLGHLVNRWQGAAGYVLPMHDERGIELGNNGDRLMLAVFRRVLGDLGIRLVGCPGDADVLVVPPNGALLEKYSFPWILERRLRDLPDRPTVIFPSSAYFPERDPSRIFGTRQTETLWILREGISFKHLKDQWGSRLSERGVHLALDHDIVVSGSRYVPEVLGGQASGSQVLVAPRSDAEGSRAMIVQPHRRLPFARQIATRAPNLIKLPLARFVRRSRTRTAAAALLAAAGVEVGRGLKRIDLDISATQFATFEDYSIAIRRSSFVVSDRLHVGLPAAVLGQRVILVETGYHKLRGVYEQSLSSLENVTFIDTLTR